MASLLTLNVSNPPKARAEALLHWLWPRREDLWVLTEVGTGAGSGLLLSVCRAAGFDVSVTDRSELGVLTVARAGSLAAAPLTPAEVLPGRVDSLVWTPGPVADDLRVLATYGAASDPLRYASKAQRERKRRWLTAYDAMVAEWVGLGRGGSDGPGLRDGRGGRGGRGGDGGRGGRGIVLGDLNLVDPVHSATLSHVLPEETAAYHALGERHGLVDAFRLLHPDEDVVSWMDHSGVGCRYDHAFVTPDLEVLDAELDPEPRVEGLTDHSALSVTVR